MKEKQKLNRAYFMYISLPNYSSEARIKRLKPAVCHAKNRWRETFIPPTLNSNCSNFD